MTDWNTINAATIADLKAENARLRAEVVKLQASFFAAQEAHPAQELHSRHRGVGVTLHKGNDGGEK